jgi:hypothetical protein
VWLVFVGRVLEKSVVNSLISHWMDFGHTCIRIHECICKHTNSIHGV